MVFDVAGETGKLVVKIDYEIVLRGPDGIKRPERINIVRSGRMIDAQALRDPQSYVVLEGGL